ncbi:MAG: TadE/TadG family type IV pilus assembly protein [Syntrophobacteraceae bacterium]
MHTRQKETGRARSRLRSEPGAWVVEFALLLLPLTLIIVGIFEFGLLIYNKQVVTNASREGTRAGIVSQQPRVTLARIQTVVNTYCTNHLITFAATNPSPTTQLGLNGTGAAFPGCPGEG